MKGNKLFYFSLFLVLALFVFLTGKSFAETRLESTGDAAEFLFEKLIELDKITPNEDIDYRDSQTNIKGEECWEFSSQFNFHETGRYAISKSGAIYEFVNNKYRPINSSELPEADNEESSSSSSNSSVVNNNNRLLRFGTDDEEDYDSEDGKNSGIGTKTRRLEGTGSTKKFPLQRSTRGTKVNMRTEPNVESPSIAQLYEGTPIEVLAESDNWYQVRIPNGYTGWIFGEYIVNRLGSRGVNGGVYAWVSADDVNLRSSPSRRASSIKKLYEGHLVEAVEQRSRSDGVWFKVFTRDGTVGWVFWKYLMRKAW